MHDLFDASTVPGLRMQREFVTPAEEAELIARIDADEMEPFRFQQWTGKRLARSYGWHYDFQAGSVSRAEPLPAWLLPLRERAAGFAGIDAALINQALLLKYVPGAGINWHRDRPVYEHVLGISLGAPAAMRFRKKLENRWQRVRVPLEPRSLYQLTGEARHEWEHSIAEMAHGTRYSITFRTLSEAGRRVTAKP